MLLNTLCDSTCQNPDDEIPIPPNKDFEQASCSSVLQMVPTMFQLLKTQKMRDKSNKIILLVAKAYLSQNLISTKIIKQVEVTNGSGFFKSSDNPKHL